MNQNQSNESATAKALARGALHPSTTWMLQIPSALLLVIGLVPIINGGTHGWAVCIYALMAIGCATAYVVLYGVMLLRQALHPMRAVIPAISTAGLGLWALMLHEIASFQWAHGPAAHMALIEPSLGTLFLVAIAEALLGLVFVIMTWNGRVSDADWFAAGFAPSSLYTGKPSTARQSTGAIANNHSTDDKGNKVDVAAKYPAAKPRYTFKDMVGMQGLKDQLLDAARLYAEEDKNGILLFGPPGGGKTLAAEALAGEIGMGFLYVNIGDMASKWINESTQNLKAIFDAAEAQQPLVLFFDEIDTILKESKSGGGGYEEGDRIIRLFLSKIVDLREKPILFIGATNFMDKLDGASIREGRIDFKIEVPMPDAEARKAIIAGKLTKESRTISDELMTRLVRHWAGFNVPRIQLVIEKACRNGPVEQDLTYADLYRALRSVQGRAAGSSTKGLDLNQLFLDPDIRSQIELLAARMTRVDEIEQAGGAIPHGIVFYGPPGTGKTTLAASLAKASGWTFLSSSGNDLVKDGALQALANKASDLRPAIVFIDEADDILADRNYSSYKMITNELLGIVDGSAGAIPDVVWVAATNHLEKMDSAALRGGRFEQKIEMRLPSDETLMKMLREWISRNASVIGGDPIRWMAEAARLMRGMSQSGIGSILEKARNYAIARKVMEGGEAMAKISLEDLKEAAKQISAGR